MIESESWPHKQHTSQLSIRHALRAAVDILFLSPRAHPEGEGTI